MTLEEKEFLEKSEAGCLVESNVVRPGTSARGVGGGVDSREGAELVGKVGLVVKAAIEGEFSPGKISAGVQLLDSALEAENASPDFGREADLFAEYLRETALAPAGAFGHFVHCGHGSRPSEPGESEVHHRMTRQAAIEVESKELLQAAQPGLRGW
jgi:hypothetical protein